jgi:hypothetical protein
MFCSAGGSWTKRIGGGLRGAECVGLLTEQTEPHRRLHRHNDEMYSVSNYTSVIKNNEGISVCVCVCGRSRDLEKSLRYTTFTKSLHLSLF